MISILSIKNNKDIQQIATNVISLYQMLKFTRRIINGNADADDITFCLRSSRLFTVKFNSSPAPSVNGV